MAKDLPYFKFFCSEWTDGDITLEDFEIQGLYINVCSYYWSNECYLSIDKLKKRFKHNVIDIDSLLKDDLLYNENGYLSIHFLDEQLEERKQTSKRNSKNGLKGGRPKKSENKPNALIPLTETKGNKRREEEIREEESEGKFTPTQFLEWFNETRTKYLEKDSNCNYLSAIDKTHLEILTSRYKGNDFSKAMFNLCMDKWANESNQVVPKHFLKPENFDKYLQIEPKTLLTKKQKLRKGWAV